MSLYNMVFGEDPLLPLILQLLGNPKVGRIRDAWVERIETGLRLAVYTRNGGNNRNHYDDDIEPGPECSCVGCTMTYLVPTHPLYLKDQDDTYDNTYATIYYSMPTDVEQQLKDLGAPEDFVLEDFAVDAPDMEQRWKDALENISGKKE